MWLVGDDVARMIIAIFGPKDQLSIYAVIRLSIAMNWIADFANLVIYYSYRTKYSYALDLL